MPTTITATNPAAPGTLSKGGMVATPTATTTPAQYAAAKAGGWSPPVSGGAGYVDSTGTYVSSANTSSPTVFSDSNIRDNVIPGLNDKANGLAVTPTNMDTISDPKGTGEDTTDDTEGNKYGVDSSDLNYSDIYNKVFGTENAKPEDPDVTRTLSTLEAMKKSNDSAFAGQVATIQSQFATNQGLLQDAQNSATRTVNNQLLKTGAYRTSAASGIPLALRTNQIAALASLQDKENDAISRVKTAQTNSDYKTMHDEMTVLDKVRADKKALATKISGELLSENEKISKQKTQSTIDNAVADAFASGKIDPNDILSEVSDKGLNVTAADITRSLNNIAKANGMDLVGLSGNVKNYFALKDSGALPSTIKALPEDQQLKAYLDMEKSSSTKTASATKPLYTTIDGTAITKNDIQLGEENLYSSRDTDGYVDSKLYLAMYNYWEEAGLPPAEFIKQYPPNLHLNPSDTSIPTYLRPTSTNGTSTINNPFGPVAPAK